jgi:hypothetical protein
MQPGAGWCLISASHETKQKTMVSFRLALGRVGFLFNPTTIQRGFMIIYTICLVVGLAFAFISAVAGHFFGGHDGGGVGTGGHAEAGYDHSGVPGISFFSPTVLACFVTAFGACGLILTKVEATKSVWVSAPISAVAGLAWRSSPFCFSIGCSSRPKVPANRTSPP